jgi:ribulose-phosphate 3-epimerase
LAIHRFWLFFATNLDHMPRLIAPSVLSADFANLQRDIEMINGSNADWFHVDVMDGVFVPNISFGFPVLKSLQKYAKKPLDVHLMIVQPERYIQEFKDAGADVLTVHYEACTHLHRTLQAIRNAGMKAGVALNPHTPIQVLSDVLHDIDLALVMSVNPGFGGQKFIERAITKVKDLAEMRKAQSASFLIEVDGGVSDANADTLFTAGADVLVAGNYVFGHANPLTAIDTIKK